MTLADAYLRTGGARRVMVVSGEYISHLSGTARRPAQSAGKPTWSAWSAGEPARSTATRPAWKYGLWFGPRKTGAAWRRWALRFFLPVCRSRVHKAQRWRRLVKQEKEVRV